MKPCRLNPDKRQSVRHLSQNCQGSERTLHYGEEGKTGVARVPPAGTAGPAGPVGVVGNEGQDSRPQGRETARRFPRSEPESQAESPQGLEESNAASRRRRA
jgi:hypothetical protein